MISFRKYLCFENIWRTLWPKIPLGSLLFINVRKGLLCIKSLTFDRHLKRRTIRSFLLRKVFWEILRRHLIYVVFGRSFKDLCLYNLKGFHLSLEKFSRAFWSEKNFNGSPCYWRPLNGLIFPKLLLSIEDQRKVIRLNESFKLSSAIGKINSLQRAVNFLRLTWKVLLP